MAKIIQCNRNMQEHTAQLNAKFLGKMFEIETLEKGITWKT